MKKKLKAVGWATEFNKQFPVSFFMWESYLIAEVQRDNIKKFIRKLIRKVKIEEVK